MSQITVDLVHQFYHDEEFTRPMRMPGMKDKVSIARNEYRQKRLILCNIKELFNAFKTRFPEVKVGFSKF